MYDDMVYVESFDNTTLVRQLSEMRDDVASLAKVLSQMHQDIVAQIVLIRHELDALKRETKDSSVSLHDRVSKMDTEFHHVHDALARMSERNTNFILRSYATDKQSTTSFVPSSTGGLKSLFSSGNSK